MRHTRDERDVSVSPLARAQAQYLVQDLGSAMCLLSLGGLDWTGHIIHVKYICGLFTRVAAQVNTRIYERV